MTGTKKSVPPVVVAVASLVVAVYCSVASIGHRVWKGKVCPSDETP